VPLRSIAATRIPCIPFRSRLRGAINNDPKLPAIHQQTVNRPPYSVTCGHAMLKNEQLDIDVRR
jgi:hypothetical protein